MRKLSVYMMTAAAAMTIAGAVPVSAYAASGTYQFPGGKMIVIGGNRLPGCDTNMQTVPGGWIPDFNLPGGQDTVTPEQPDGGMSMDAYVKKVVDLVNAERAKAGLPSLSVNMAAAGAARTRAGEIETVFSHTRPDGSNFSTVLTAAGVTYRSAGENIAYGQQTPEQVMTDWMNSSGHRANILNSEFTSIGVGHYKNAAGVDYWTQLFIN